MQAGVTSVEGDTRSAQDGASSVPCLNCGHPLDGPFCGRCGQRAVPPHPTVRELVGDTWAELVGWDGKAARTVRTLVRHPGELTAALLEGRRARYVPPIRLYLTCSLLYFVLAAGVPVPDVEFDGGFSVGVSTGTDVEEWEPGEREFGKAVMQGLATLAPDEQRAAEAYIATEPWVLRPMLRAMAIDYAGMRRRITAMMPRAFFVLVPALAGILALFHRRRNFPDHLYFAIHLQTLVFLVGLVVVIAQYSRVIPVMATAQLGAAIAIAVYMVLAQRRVYGGGWTAGVLKTVAVCALYLALFGVMSTAVAIWVSRSV